MIANNALMGGVVLPRLGQAQLRGRFRTKYRIYNRDTGAALSNATITSPVIDNDRRQTIPIYIERVCESQVIGQYGVPVPACVTALGWSAATVTLVEKLLTITYSARTDAEFAYYGPLPGDVILDGATGSVFFVKSRSALVVEAILQNNYVSDGAGGYDPITALTFASGTYYIANSRFYTPGYYLRADITSGSAVAANAGNDAGTSFITDASFGVAVDDYYHADPNSDAIFTPTNAKVASRTSSSITFTGNATRTEPVRKRLGIFIRQPPANV
jgi:hypothetical protein